MLSTQSVVSSSAQLGPCRSSDHAADVVIKVKQKLASTSVPSPTVVDDLHALAALGEKFTEKRHRANKRYTDLANALDREGN